ncbi:hypothetical protein BAY59_00415 [Prauserella coralliicola]|nr:hypothetical protein BAY59_00415 [Prauserella coralliicola]
MTVNGLHFVGSVNLPDAESTFRSLASSAGAHARRLPDGETGERLGWIIWLSEALRQTPALEVRSTGVVAGLEWPKFGIRADVTSDDFEVHDFGHAKAARRSYRIFRQLRQEGAIASGTRFQVTLPTPGAILVAFIDPPDQLRLEGPIKRVMARAIAEIAAEIPAGDLAFQWDSPAEVGIVEGVFPPYYADSATKQEVVRRLVDLGALVPAGVQLGYHLCYGDTGDVDDPEGSHWKNPDDLAVVCRLMNELTVATTRPIDFFHVPVPIQRDDAAYFSPLKSLRIPKDCELYLGLLHREDGLEGARRRISAARPFRAEFGLATECGMGREHQESIPGLLELHAFAAEL